MSRLFVHGLGAVSPAGWGVAALSDALRKSIPLNTTPLARPGLETPFQIRPVPSPPSRPAFLAHPRLRRASPVAQHVVAAALEALGDDIAKVQAGALRLGIIVCTMAGSVAYSRRFYEEALREPATASPLLFPETVFNAPASHLAAYLGSPEINYSLVGDDGTFLNGLALAAEWLVQGRVDSCVIIGSEELDWVVADAARLFHRETILGAGAGALYLKREGRCVAGGKPFAELGAITDPFLFTTRQARRLAAQRMRDQLPALGKDEVLALGTNNLTRLDAAELAAWADWSGLRLAPKLILGEGFTASAAWQCVAGCDALRTGDHSAVNVSVVGANQQAIGARFLKTDSGNKP